MALSSQVLYEECKGTLIPGNDPSGAGSQAATYGYTAGNGTSLQDKLELLNATQGGTSPRPINVDVRPQSDTVPGPGKVVGTIFAQSLKQSVDLEEDSAMMQADGAGAITLADRDKWIYAKEAYFNMPTDTNFVVTDEMQSQLLDAIPAAHMPDTRNNLIAALTRSGSRHEEMDGTSVTLEQMQAANAWGEANDPGYVSLYT